MVQQHIRQSMFSNGISGTGHVDWCCFCCHVAVTVGLFCRWTRNKHRHTSSDTVRDSRTLPLLLSVNPSVVAMHQVLVMPLARVAFFKLVFVHIYLRSICLSFTYRKHTNTKSSRMQSAHNPRSVSMAIHNSVGIAYDKDKHRVESTRGHNGSNTAPTWWRRQQQQQQLQHKEKHRTKVKKRNIHSSLSSTQHRARVGARSGRIAHCGWHATSPKFGRRLHTAHLLLAIPRVSMCPRCAMCARRSYAIQCGYI